MRVAAFTELVGPEGVSVIDADAPTPAAGEAVVAVEACAINRHDLWILEGDSAMLDSIDLPFVTGLDVAGVVESVGAGVSNVSEGDRVVLCPNETCGTCRYCREGPENLCPSYSIYHGGLAEEALVSADRLVALPDGVGMTTAAALPTAYMTALRMLLRAEVTAGDLVLVPGATGGVGVAAVQLAGVMGARAIGTSTSAAKLAHLDDLGCAHTIESGDTDEIAREVERIGRPAAVINHLGGPFTAMGLSVLDRDGRMVVCGRTAGDVSEISIPGLFRGHHHVIGSTMGTQGDLERLVSLVADGAFQPVVGETYSLEETGQAFADMQSRDAIGKLVVTP
jgi:NADPH:quinone reductase-like Zn-dependent oxidoreductase